MKLSALVVALVLIACGQSQPQVRSPKPASQPENVPRVHHTPMPSGVTGRVVKKVGNFMPGVVGNPHSGGKVTPLAVPVHVFKGVVPVTQTFDPKHPAYVTTVKSDANGEYHVALPAGVYTVVAEIDGKLYLNAFDGSNNWSTVNVAPSAYVKWDIADTSHAAF